MAGVLSPLSPLSSPLFSFTLSFPHPLPTMQATGIIRLLLIFSLFHEMNHIGLCQKQRMLMRLLTLSKVSVSRLPT